MGWYKGPCGSHHAQQCKFPDLVKKARKEFVKTTESNSFVTFGNMSEIFKTPNSYSIKCCIFHFCNFIWVERNQI